MRLKTYCAGCGVVIPRGTLALHVDIDNAAGEPRKAVICNLCICNEADALGVDAVELVAVKQDDGWHLLPRHFAGTSSVEREGEQ